MSDDLNSATAPPRPAGNLVTSYQQAPGGLTSVVIFQLVMATYHLLMAIMVPILSQVAIRDRLTSFALVAIFAISAWGMHLRRGWGWWITCLIYFTMLFCVPVGILLVGLGELKASLLLRLGWGAVAICIVLYLNHSDALRFIRFRTPDGRPSAATRASPLVAGMVIATLQLVIGLLQ